MKSTLLDKSVILRTSLLVMLAVLAMESNLKAQEATEEFVVTRSELSCFLRAYNGYVEQANSIGSVIVRFETCPNLPSLADVMEALAPEASNNLGQPIFQEERSGRAPIALSLEEAQCVAEQASAALSQTAAEEFALSQFGCF